jgi:hypothetical protein
MRPLSRGIDLEGAMETIIRRVGATANKAFEEDISAQKGVEF